MLPGCPNPLLFRQGTQNQITLSLSCTHTDSNAQAQGKETVKDGLSNFLILCLLSLITDEMNVSLLLLSSLLLLAFSCFLPYWARLLPSDE